MYIPVSGSGEVTEKPAQPGCPGNPHKMGINKDRQAGGNGPILQSQPWHTEQKKTSILFRRKNTSLAIYEEITK